ncbi:hypothetical protein GCM10011515_16750 [Tsuneonella deserti]|uniref:Uncharacterized protein n=1 Tax=Tsuneonella deserti TaxID=2035528 RepID=A0ABQ1SA61_9SPHN|nr:hypothetical protein [Tsuneonella deserti]GGD97631.1 hypothetical protein GCM10011515_16750 [Tsuneonella deserti]
MSFPVDALQQAAQRHIVTGETILHHQVEDDEYIAVTDRRIVRVKVGSILGERSESVPLGAITTMSTTVKKGKVGGIQLAVPGRTMGEIMLSGDDLSSVMRAIVSAMPRYEGAQ